MSRCLDSQTSPENAFKASKHLLTRYLEDFGCLGIAFIFSTYSAHDFRCDKGPIHFDFFGGEVAKGGRLTPSSRAIFVSMLQFKETNDGFNGDTVDGRNLAPY